MFLEDFLKVFKSTHFWFNFEFKVDLKVKNCVKYYKNIKKLL